MTLSAGLLAVAGLAQAFDAVETPRPVPATRPEMKKLLEDMKQRPLRIPLPELTDADREELGERADSYETRLRYHYLPKGETSVFGGARPSGGGQGGQGRRGEGNRGGGNATAGQRDFSRNADENMTLTYPFKTMLFWIVSRTNNCQYCLGHQEQKLSAVGMSDDQIAALDFDWSQYKPAEQAAFAYARKLTYEPNNLTDEDITDLKKFYTDLQILEMTTSVAGNNAINRWKEGAGIPQSKNGSMFFRRNNVSAAPSASQPDESFLTPTSSQYETTVSKVAALAHDDASGKIVDGATLARPPLESRADVEAGLKRASERTERLPLVTEEAAREAYGEAVPEGRVPSWMRLLANFPNESKGRVRSLLSINDANGDLPLLLKAQVSWIIARQDRAWYATGVVQKRLRELGQTDDQIFALDGDWAEQSEHNRALFRFARNLACSPVVLSDEDVAEALRVSSPREVVQLVNFTTSRAYFDRVTEAAGLRID
jgi:alkylhydroperoxidase family enzyme